MEQAPVIDPTPMGDLAAINPGPGGSSDQSTTPTSHRSTGTATSW